MKVVFPPLWEAITGCAQAELTPAPATVGAALRELVERWPALGRELYEPGGALDYAYQVLVNGRSLAYSEVLLQTLRDGDKLLLEGVGVLGGG